MPMPKMFNDNIYDEFMNKSHIGEDEKSAMNMFSKMMEDVLDGLHENYTEENFDRDEEYRDDAARKCHRKDRDKKDCPWQDKKCSCRKQDFHDFDDDMCEGCQRKVERRIDDLGRVVWPGKGDEREKCPRERCHEDDMDERYPREKWEWEDRKEGGCRGDMDARKCDMDVIPENRVFVELLGQEILLVMESDQLNMLGQTYRPIYCGRLVEVANGYITLDPVLTKMHNDPFAKFPTPLSFPIEKITNFLPFDCQERISIS